MKLKTYKNYRGFTLVEILMVIAIIGLLSTLSVVSLRNAKDKARISKTAHEIKHLQTVFDIYHLDTDRLPGECRVHCNALTDPFVNSLGVDGWNGPYIKMGIYNKKHEWGGHIGIENGDYDNDGKIESFMVLDDDPPGATPSNSGQIPNNMLMEIDKLVDDGNLSTGRFMTNVSGISTGAGSAVWMLINP